jgi:hypothetical protein
VGRLDIYEGAGRVKTSTISSGAIGGCRVHHARPR